MVRTMMRSRAAGLVLGFLMLAGITAGHAAEADRPAPGLLQVYELVRTNVAGLTEDELNRKAVRALVDALGPNVSLVDGESAGGAEDTGIAKTDVYDGPVGYVRIGVLTDQAASEARTWFEQTNRTNRLRGVVLDLRFATGRNYEAAAALAELFARKETTILDWGEGPRRVTSKAPAIGVPAAVLVNRQTTGAAEAVAAVMREIGAGLLLGTRTAGQAMVYRDFKLENGQTLKVAAAPVRLGNGEALGMGGVKPDIRVEVDPKDERLYLEDPFASLARPDAAVAPGGAAARNGRRARFGEAELIRERSEGLDPAEVPLPERTVTDAPVVMDPVLARALDLLKGLAVVRGEQSPGPK